MFTPGEIWYKPSLTAKLVNRNIGKNQLLSFLRMEDVINHINIPEPLYVDLGYFSHKPKPIVQRGKFINNAFILLTSTEGVKFIQDLIDSKPGFKPPKQERRAYHHRVDFTECI